MYAARMYSTRSVALSMDREHDYENNVEYKIFLSNVPRNLQKEMQRYASPERKINLFIYGADIPYSQDFSKHFFFFKQNVCVSFFFLFYKQGLIKKCLGFYTQERVE